MTYVYKMRWTQPRRGHKQGRRLTPGYPILNACNKRDAKRHSAIAVQWLEPVTVWSAPTKLIQALNGCVWHSLSTFHGTPFLWMQKPRSPCHRLTMAFRGGSNGAKLGLYIERRLPSWLDLGMLTDAH